MIISNLKTLIQNGEGLTTEFKSSKSKLNKDIYETVCAFLNRDGGDILLGVSDKVHQARSSIHAK